MKRGNANRAWILMSDGSLFSYYQYKVHTWICYNFHRLRALVPLKYKRVVYVRTNVSLKLGIVHRILR